MTKLDLKDAYLSVAVHPASQRFLRNILKNKSYQFQAEEIEHSPTRVHSVIITDSSFSEKRGIRLIIYLGDILLIGSSIKETRLFTEMTMSLLESFGFIINEEKSVLHRTQTHFFLFHSMLGQHNSNLASRQGHKVTLAVPSTSHRREGDSSQCSTNFWHSRVFSTSHMAGSTSHSQTLKSSETRATQILINDNSITDSKLIAEHSMNTLLILAQA